MSLHRCDGPDLAALLVQVQQDFGPSAVVVSAEKVRRGGVGGFFAREWYEVSVEVADAGEPGGVLDEVVSDTLDVLDLSTIGRLKDDLRSDTPDVPEAILPSTEQHEFADVLASLAGVTSARPPAATTPDEPLGSDLVAASESSPVPAADTDITAAEDSSAADPLTAPPPAEDAVAAVDPAMSEPREPAAIETAPRSGALAALGVPHELLVVLADTEPDTWTGALGAVLPLMPSLPRLAGSILAVVGAADTALPQAMELAKRIGAPDQLYVARRTHEGIEVPAAYLLPDGDAVLERSRRFARSSAPTTVAVVLDGDPDGTEWLVDVMRHLTPDQTWLAVRAGARTEDVTTLAKLVGGADVLCLSDMGATSAPATLLGLDLPVATLDGVAATPRRWATLITERLDGELPDRLGAGITGAAPTLSYGATAAGSHIDADLGVVVAIDGSTRPAFSKLRRSGN
jgi:hypothetical protein